MERIGASEGRILRRGDRFAISRPPKKYRNPRGQQKAKKTMTPYKVGNGRRLASAFRRNDDHSLLGSRRCTCQLLRVQLLES